MRDPHFEQFVRAQSGALLRLAYVLTRSHRDAEDLVQEVLLSALRKWDLVSSADRPEAYVRRMLVNNHISSRRRSSRREVVLDLDLISLGDPHSTDQQDAVDARSWAATAIRDLPQPQQAVLVLRYYERLDDSEIADILDVARGTVRSLASRAFATLRQHPQLAHYEDPPEGSSPLRKDTAPAHDASVATIGLEGQA